MDKSLDPNTIDGRLRQKMVDRGEPVMTDDELTIYRLLPIRGSSEDKGERYDMFTAWQMKHGIIKSFESPGRLEVMERFKKSFEKVKK